MTTKMITTQEALIAHVMSLPEREPDYDALHRWMMGEQPPIGVRRATDEEELEQFWRDVEARLYRQRNKNRIAITHYLIASPIMFLMHYPNGRVVEITLPNDHTPFNMRVLEPGRWEEPEE